MTHDDERFVSVSPDSALRVVQGVRRIPPEVAMVASIIIINPLVSGMMTGQVRLIIIILIIIMVVLVVVVVVVVAVVVLLLCGHQSVVPWRASGSLIGSISAPLRHDR